MSLLNNLGMVRKDHAGSKEVFQEVPSCCSALAKAPALSIISSAEPLMTGDPLDDGSAAFNIVWQMKLLALQYVSKKLPRKNASFRKNHCVPQTLQKLQTSSMAVWNDEHSFSVTIHDLFSLISLFLAKVRWNQNKNYQRIKKPVLKTVIINGYIRLYYSVNRRRH